MLDGEFQESSRSYFLALKVLRQLILSGDVSEVNPVQPYLGLSFVDLSGSPTLRNGRGHPRKLRVESDMFIYSKPIAFRIPSNDHDIDTVHEDQEALNSLSACVVFNLALAFHLEGLCRLSCPTTKAASTKTYEKLTKAKRFYEMTLELLDRSPTTLSNEDESIMALIRLAAINNSSQLICDVEDNFDESKERLQMAAKILESNQSRGLNNLLKEEEMNGFFMNACMILHRRDVAPAA